MLTLDDVKPRVVDVTVIAGKLPPEEEGGLPRDHEIVVPVRVPSYIEWQELGLDVPEPEPEQVIVFKNGKKTYEKESGPAFERKKMLANNQRMIRRMTFALIEAGNFPELKDAPLEQQMAAVQGMDAGIFQAIVRVLNALVQMTSGRVAETATRFRPGTVSANGDAGVQPQPVVVETLDEPAES